MGCENPPLEGSTDTNYAKNVQLVLPQDKGEEENEKKDVKHSPHPF